MDPFVSPVSSRGSLKSDDKENADPRLTLDRLRQREDKGKEKKKRLFEDGFDVGDDLRLDSDKDVEQDDVENNPMAASLIKNRVLFVPTDATLNLCSDSADNGASPLFLNQTDGGFRRRCLSVVENQNASPVSRNSSSNFKRPAAPCLTDAAHQFPKRRRALHEGHQHPMRSSSTPAIGSQLPKTLSRSKSMLDAAAAAQIIEAVSLDDECLTGDKKNRLTLPTVKVTNKNCHLHNIDCHTLARVVRGEFDDRIRRCRILDARYCYEFEGGHIRNADNFGSWDETSFINEFFPSTMKPKPRESLSREEEEKRDILVFHCEFSSARGPALLSKLRNQDRKINQSTFPALHYPECYLLHEGYKTFFENYPELCDPQSYVPMNHKDYEHEERRFHRKSKSWAAGGGSTVSRTGASSRLLKL